MEFFEFFSELDNGKESPFELYTGKELSSINFRRMSDSAHCCVQIFKKLIHHGVKVISEIFSDAFSYFRFDHDQ